MIIYNDLKQLETMKPCCVALGNFDGVHLGHQALIRATVAKAKEKGLHSCVFTFSTHPKNLIPGAKPVKNIIYQEEKAALMEDLGVDYLVNIEFSREVMCLAPEDFVYEILIKKLQIKEAFCGFNYHFGFEGRGDLKLLRILGAKYGFHVNETKAVAIDGDIISSSLIRGLIMAGEMDECSRYLGRNYSIGGEVIIGNRLGRTIGFPTSNIMIDDSMVSPPNGVYITYCIYQGVRHPSITNVGVRPTVGNFQKNMETHIFDFNRELYGKFIQIEFIKKTRDEVKFHSVQELAQQIQKDCQHAKEFHRL